MPTKTAMILAAGRGERLRPLTDSTPKPLIHVGKYRLIEYHLHALAAIGIERVVINVAYLADQIQSVLGDGSRYGIEIVYSPEPEGALETAGGIRHALPLLGDDPFLVLNGDVLCDYPLEKITIATSKWMHLLLVPNPDHHPVGDFGLDYRTDPCDLTLPPGSEGRLTYAGIGLFRPRLFRHLKAGRHPLAPIIQQCIRRGQASGERHDGYWSDVGDVSRLASARSTLSHLEHDH